MKIYVVTHKPVDLQLLALDKCYSVIRVGQYAREQNGLLSDAEGNNIAEKNPNYCELTAQYWMWKNDTTSEVIGMCHYRRYFTTHALSVNPKNFLKEKDAEYFLKTYDAIVPYNQSYCVGAYKKYLSCGYEKDLKTTKEAIQALYPEYVPFYEKYFEKSASFRLGNMLIMKREVFDAYCEWLFNILQYVEKRTDLSGYSAQEARIYGYLSERLLNVWLFANKVKCKSMRIVNTEEIHNVTYYGKEILKFIKIYDLIKSLIFRLQYKE